jgi:hypothetical protein
LCAALIALLIIGGHVATIRGLTISPQTVFVLGAGFTRAFLPAAPLLYDDYDSDALLKKLAGQRHACDLLQIELNRSPDGKKINIERLMTRLDGQMPYDSSLGASEQFALLLRKLKQNFRRRIEGAKQGDYLSEDLQFFASFCIKRGVTIVTFNYDDLLDEALWSVKKVLRGPSTEPYWHPDGGYGFFCKPAESCIRDGLHNLDRTSMFLWKLHGSINWWPKLGSSTPHDVQALVHFEQWFPLQGRNTSQEVDRAAIERHLEPEPFIVAPVLVKSSLVREPILRLVWSEAYKALLTADQVFFIGYSLPPTDLAARFLFTEALRQLPPNSVRVVNLAQGESEERTRAAYRDVLPYIGDEHFDFSGALEWVRELRDADGKP